MGRQGRVTWAPSVIDAMSTEPGTMLRMLSGPASSGGGNGSLWHLWCCYSHSYPQGYELSISSSHHPHLHTENVVHTAWHSFFTQLTIALSLMRHHSLMDFYLMCFVTTVD